MSQIRQCFKLRLFFVLGCLFTVSFSVGSLVPDVRIVMNPSVKSTSISVGQIRRVFSMRQTVWADGQAITVYVLPSQHQTHQVFSTKVLGMFPYQLDRIWNKLVYSGLGEEPLKVKSEQEMMERVSQTPGAIGYVMGPVTDDNVKVTKLLVE